jgi:T-complex protein 1 subunit theta
VGGSLNQSTVIKGMVLLRQAEGIVTRAEKAKVIVYGCGFEASSSEAKGTVLIKNAEELMNYNKSEERKMVPLVFIVVSYVQYLLLLSVLYLGGDCRINCQHRG